MPLLRYMVDKQHLEFNPRKGNGSLRYMWIERLIFALTNAG